MQVSKLEYENNANLHNQFVTFAERYQLARTKSVCGEPDQMKTGLFKASEMEQYS